MSKVMGKAGSKSSAFAGLGDVLAGGFDATLTSDANEQMVNLQDIEVRAQDRTVFEDDENSLADLGRSLRKQQLQAILLRPNDRGADKPFVLVAGERRYRAALLEGLTQLRARVKPMTDEEAEEAQFAENIHRKNLTQVEEAKRVQRDLDQLGSVEAVLAKHNKGRPWLSKILSLLRLPEQAQRLVKENISADLEVINTVRTIESADPGAARAVVDELRDGRGRINAREAVARVKDQVKPSKAKAAKTPKRLDEQRERDVDQTATAPEPTAEQAQVFAGAKNPQGTFDAGKALNDAYANMHEFGSHPKMMVELLKSNDLDGITAKWLRDFFNQGRKSRCAPAEVLKGLDIGTFSKEGAPAFALVAFMHGVTSKAFGGSFNLEQVFREVKEGGEWK
jgi:ParB family chromosome partitioning protein